MCVSSSEVYTLVFYLAIVKKITSLSLLVGTTVGECLLISSLPGKASRTLVDIARLAE